MRFRRFLCKVFGHRFEYGRAELIVRSMTGEDVDVGLRRFCPRCYASTMTDGVHHHYPKEIGYGMTQAQLREAFPSHYRRD